MKAKDAGFVLIEAIVFAALVAVIVSAATFTFSNIVRRTGDTNDQMIAYAHLESASYWINTDGIMADNIITEDLEPPDFLILSWTDWGYQEDSIYHAIKYSIVDAVDGVGKLKRTHQDSLGGYEELIVADNVYYNPGDVDNTSQVTFQAPVLEVKLVVLFGQNQEIRESQVCCRPNF